MAKGKGGKKNRKFGRNLIFCKAYREGKRREKNKIKKIKRHLKAHPGDRRSMSALEKFELIV